MQTAEITRMTNLKEELLQLEKRVHALGRRVESSLELSIESVKRGTDHSYEEIREMEDQIDRSQLEIDSEAIRLLAEYSPIAADLRLILSVNHINAALERIGDQSVNIAKYVRQMKAAGADRFVGHFHPMLNLVQSMVSDSLEAFAQRDLLLAEAVMDRDEQVDILDKMISREILKGEHLDPALSWKEGAPVAFAQIMLSRAIERAADRACNICQEVFFIVEGKDLRHQPA
jgi:phosphate transport system protein